MRVRLAACLLLVACTGPALQPEAPQPEAPQSEAPQSGPWTNLDAEDWRALAFGGEGQVDSAGGRLLLGVGAPLTGVRWPGAAPRGDYELELVATKLQGHDFFVGLTFPVGSEHLTLVLGGWGGALCGLSCIDGQDASGNSTKFFQAFDLDRAYRVRVTVAGSRVRCAIDGQTVVDVDTAGHELSLRTEVEACAPLGLATFLTRAELRGIRWRRSPGER